MSPAAFIDNPGWADFLPEIREPARRRRLPAHEDCSLLDVETVARHLHAGGTLGMMSGYEERPGQIAMLAAIVRAFNGRGHLLVEAGTGVGKSIAYLVASILWAWTNDTPVVVSTATRNLQSQLVNSDIPKALAVLGDSAGEFKFALLKGRANYLCLRAVGEFFAAGYWTMSAEEQAEMPRFIEWLRSTPDGDLDGYDGLQRSQLTCPGEECGARRCPYYSRCFVYRARKRAAEAHLVIANHALVLAEATAPGGSILPSYARLVVDEAHNLEATATEYLSRELSLASLSRILSRLVRRSRGSRTRPGGILASVERQIRRGALPEASGGKAMQIVSECSAAAAWIMRATAEVLSLSSLMLKPAGKSEMVRFKVAAGRRCYSVRGIFAEYDSAEWDETQLAAAAAKMESRLAVLVRLLHNLRDILDDAAQGSPVQPGDLSAQLNGIAESLVGFANDADFVLKGEKESYAYWVERLREGKGRGVVRLVAAPLSVASELDRMLYEPKDSVVLCSATLRVGNDFKYMMRRLGANGRFACMVADSPFDYLRQALVLASDCLPDPSVASGNYAEGLARLMKDVFAATEGRALVLFTSYEMMRQVADCARESLAREGIELLVQGEGLSRETMTRQLRESGRRVLFGAQSFWEGVDVAGEALSCVVIARLPFAMVGDPVVEARAEKIEREGGSAFRDYFLPEAVIKFRQGFGRLIRTKRDRGVVIVADPRIVTKNYGGSFRKSIPASVHAVAEPSELVARVVDFFM